MEKTTIRTTATLVAGDEKGKVTLYVMLDEFEREDLLLERGKVPEGIITVVVRG